MQNRNLLSPLTGKPLASYEPVKDSQRFKQTHITIHSAQMNAAMLAIKPGFKVSYAHFLFSFCMRYNKNMVFKYLKTIREADNINYTFGKLKREDFGKIVEKEPIPDVEQ